MSAFRPGGLLLGVAVFLSACSLTLAAPPPAGDLPFRTQPWPTPTPALPPAGLSLEEGRALFRQRCAACHGPLGRGDGPQAAALRVRTPDARLDLTEGFATRTATLRDWFQVITEGRPERGMPPWREALSEPERWAMALYAWSLAVPPEALAEAPRRYREACAACHGADGRQGPSPLTDPERVLGRSPAAGLEALRSERIPAHRGLEGIPAAEQAALMAYLPYLAFSVSGLGALQPPRPVATATVQGQVLNGSRGAPAAGVTVTLYALVESTPIFSQTTRTAADGSYRLEGVPVYPEARYLPLAEWEGVHYPATAPLTLTAGVVATAMLMVFDRSADPGGIRVDQVHWILQPLADRLLVTEIWVYSNRGPTTYGGPEGPGMIFFLPPGVQNLQVSEGEMGARYRQEGDRLIDTAPVPPGMGDQVAFGYELPLARARTLTFRSAYPVGRFNLLIAGESLRAAGPGLQDRGIRVIGSTPYRLYEVDSPMPGGALVVTLGPATPFPIGALALTIAGGLGLAVLWLRWGAGRRIDPIEEIAQLDAAYEAGEVDAETYRRRRAALKEQAVRLWRARTSRG